MSPKYSSVFYNFYHCNYFEYQGSIGSTRPAWGPGWVNHRLNKGVESEECRREQWHSDTSHNGLSSPCSHSLCWLISFYWPTMTHKVPCQMQEIWDVMHSPPKKGCLYQLGGSPMTSAVHISTAENLVAQGHVYNGSWSTNWYGGIWFSSAKHNTEASFRLLLDAHKHSSLSAHSISQVLNSRSRPVNILLTQFGIRPRWLCRKPVGIKEGHYLCTTITKDKNHKTYSTMNYPALRSRGPFV